MDAEPWQAHPNGVEVRLRVTPRGGRDAVDGVETLSDGRRILKVRVRVAPEGGAANEAVRRLLARTLRCPASAVSLEAGVAARFKTFRIDGDPVRLAAVLAGLAPSGSSGGAP
jgi:uncharacterized protein YggU (UPF0235/DUF167 family)